MHVERRLSGVIESALSMGELFSSSTESKLSPRALHTQKRPKITQSSIPEKRPILGNSGFDQIFEAFHGFLKMEKFLDSERSL